VSIRNSVEKYSVYKTVSIPFSLSTLLRILTVLYTLYFLCVYTERNIVYTKQWVYAIVWIKKSILYIRSNERNTAHGVTLGLVYMCVYIHTYGLCMYVGVCV